MKIPILLQLAALSSAFVLPNEQVFQQLEVETYEAADSAHERLPSKHSLFDNIEHKYHKISDKVHKKFDKALSKAYFWSSDAHDTAERHLDTAFFAGKSWISSAVDNSKYCGREDEEEGLYALGIKDFSRPHKPPHGRHPPHKPNMTVYELIAKSKYTTKLAEIISEYDDLVKLLNGTTANFTIFAPTDMAFKKIHGHKPTKEQLEKILTYHVVGDFFPVGRILGSRTLPSLLKEPALGKGAYQRLTTDIGFRGLTVNFYARVIAANIFGTNGVIHGIDSILVPPPPAIDIINFLPSEFSTLNLGLTKTGLSDKLNSTDHKGGTLFAPSNGAFSKLGPRLNGFLFSKYGIKYLKALLQYHVVPHMTLYSDAFYNGSSAAFDAAGPPHRGPPKGVFHVDLPTLLEDRSLSIDIARWGRLIEIKINAFARVAVSDGIAKDGVIHVLGDVLIPPKKVGGVGEVADGEMTVEELRERLEPFVEKEDEFEDEYDCGDWDSEEALEYEL